MTDLVSDPDPKGDNTFDSRRPPHQGLTASTPRWVKVFGTVMVVLVLVFVALHLTGHGLGGHTTIRSAAQQP